MGYRRTGKTYKKRTGGKPWYRKKYSAMEIASKALSMAKYMKGMINCEKKYHDTSGAPTPSDSGQIALVSGIPAGDDNTNRSGNSVLVRSLYVKFRCSVNTTNTENNQNIRLILFIDKQQNGAAPTVSNILQTFGGTNSIVSPLNLDMAPRFKVLYDKVFNLSKLDNTGNAGSVFKKLYFHAKYTGTGGSDVFTNQIYHLLISDQPTNQPAITIYTRMGFYDN